MVTDPLARKDGMKKLIVLSIATVLLAWGAVLWFDSLCFPLGALYGTC